MSFLQGSILMAATPLYSIELEAINGKKYSFQEYKGQVVLVVNTASHCGFTPQYEGLQALYQEFKEKGFVILGAPCNQFGNQEPEGEAEIKKFCSLKYGVTFPLLKKLEVKGSNQHPLFQSLIALSPEHHDIRWNFEKFLVSKSGTVLNRFSSFTTPSSSDLKKAIQNALAEKPNS